VLKNAASDTDSGSLRDAREEANTQEGSMMFANHINEMDTKMVV